MIPDFVIQAGCPQGRGTGGPGYTNQRRIQQASARSGRPVDGSYQCSELGRSQFFLCLGRVPHLDNSYTGFGKTADDASLKFVLSIGNVETNADDRPLKDVKIKTARCSSRPRHSRVLLRSRG